MRIKEYNLLEKIGISILIPLAYVLGDKESFENLFMNIYGIRQPIKNKK